MPITVGELLEGWFKWLIVFGRIVIVLIPLVVVLLVASMVDSTLHDIAVRMSRIVLNTTDSNVTSLLPASTMVRSAIRYVLAPALIIASVVALLAGSLWLVRR